ncbi:NADH-quinone oxidoreductase subunit N [Gammaproteobacteria bacterium]
MTLEMLKLAAACPEILVLVGACVILMVDVFRSQGEERSLTYGLSLLLLLLGGGVTFSTFGENVGPALNGHFIKDSLGDLIKLFIYLTAFATFVYSRDYLRERRRLKGEFLVLGLFAVLGMLMMVSAGSFLTLFLGLELLSLPLYAMIALESDSPMASEAAIKYFVMGAIASGMLLYGMSMFYGATGSLDLIRVSEAVHRMVAGNVGQEQLVLIFGTVFIVVGVAFKLGAVPFHMWVPDVYQGASTPMTLFLGTAPKLAGFAMLVRLLVGALDPLVGQWQQMLAVLAVLSIAVGNVVAISQTNLKRMLGYSTIAHVGFMLLGIIAGNPQGYGAALFYVIIYALMAAGSFGMILLLSRVGFEADLIEDFKGLSDRSPWFAAMMAILMFSMAGVPPFVGFWAKWEVLRAVVYSGQMWIALVAVAFSVIGAWYYLRVIWYMYFEKPRDTVPAPLVPAVEMGIMMSANGLVLLYLGVFPSSLMAVCLMVWGGR